MISSAIVPFARFSTGGLKMSVRIISDSGCMDNNTASLNNLIVSCKAPCGNSFTGHLCNRVLFGFNTCVAPRITCVRAVKLRALSTHCHIRDDGTLRLTGGLHALPRVRCMGCMNLRSGPCRRLTRHRFNGATKTVVYVSLRDGRTYFDFLGGLGLVRHTAGLFSGHSLTVRPTDAVFNTFSRGVHGSVSMGSAAVHLDMNLRSVSSLFRSVGRTMRKVRGWALGIDVGGLVVGLGFGMGAYAVSVES